METKIHRAIFITGLCHVLLVLGHTKENSLRRTSNLPEPPEVVEAIAQTTTTITINITAPYNDVITKYKVDYDVYSIPVDANENASSTIFTTPATLVPGSAYAFHVKSIDVGVESKTYTGAIGYTLPNPPRDVTVVDRRTTRVILMVQPGTGHHDTFCAVYFSVLHPGQSKNISDKSVLLSIPDLLPGTSYNISVFTIANNILSTRAKLNGMIISTLPSPSKVRVTEKTTTSLNLSVKPGEGRSVMYSSPRAPSQHIDMITEDTQLIASTPSGIQQNVSVEDETLGEICSIPGYISGPVMAIEGSTVRFLAIFSVNLSCVSSSIRHEIEWYIGDLNTSNIRKDSSRVHIQSNYSQEEFPWSYLTFQTLSVLDEKPLRACYIGKCYTKAAIRVQPLLHVRMNPASVAVEVGGQAKLSCIVPDYKKIGDLEFKWTFSGIGKSNESKLHDYPSTKDGVSNLQLQNITQQHTGSYTCTVMSFNANTTTIKKSSSFLYVFTEDAFTCPKTTDKNGLVWTKTPTGQILTMICPDGFVGSATRVCNIDGLWGKTNLINCVRKAIDNALDQINGIKDGVVDPSEINNVLDLLENTTSTSNRNSIELSSGDLSAAYAVLNASIDVIDQHCVSPNVTQNFVKIIDNMLSPANHETWTDVNKQSSSTDASNLMKTVEKLGNAVGNKISVGEQIIIEGSNIAVEIKSISNNNICFRPKISSSNSNLQNEITLNLGDGHTGGVTFTAALYATIASILPDNSVASGYPSEVLALSVINEHSVEGNLPSNVSLKFDTDSLRSDNNLTGNVNIKCVFWNFNDTAGAIGWSDVGCMWSAEKRTCLCNHLTNFAVLMSPIEITNELDIARLRVITLAGCSLSILSTVVTMVVYMMLWRYVKNDRSILVVNLCVAVTGGYVLFLAGLDQTDDNVGCTVIAALLHFLFLAIFCLMLSDGIQLLRRTTVVLNVKSILKWLLLIGWGVPAIIVGITVGIKHDGGYHSKKYCWLTLKDGVLYSFVGPVLAVIVVNVIVVILVLKALLTSKFIMTKSQRQRIVSAIRSVCVLLPVLGITWFFGILSINGDLLAFQYLFAVTNSLQGFFIFLFHCIFSVPVRRAMKQKYKKFELTSKSDKTQVTATRSSRYSVDDGIGDPYKNGKIDRLSVSHHRI
ncbi:adhesion G protein-coupled receptor F5-like isoform X2 [Mizuhopecten yessoensis]|uniref:adhesion G protein-coupled receptor F5-like isoform X2 n=1 Tax=Mizuhopecten yessoensis TaxID=6573 RepID=UPI000B45C889|nr:adhesion G protein-coupled receptor F5-like isoform X2 [Mizuhopecten yessoensis]